MIGEIKFWIIYASETHGVRTVFALVNECSEVKRTIKQLLFVFI